MPMMVGSSSQKGSAAIFILFLLSLLLGGIISLKIEVDRIPRQKIPGASIIYIPSGKYLKYATFGYSSLVADLVYLWAIQYYSTFTIVDRYQNLEHIFSIIAELDPRYQDPYEIGALIAVYEARNLELACKILDLGLAKNPDQWIFPFQAGHYAQMAKNYEMARKYYQKTMRIAGAPDIVKRLYAAAGFMTMDLETSWKTWREIYETSPDEHTKKIAAKHLYRVKSALDLMILKEAIAKFKEHYRRYPENLEELIRARLLPSLPKDLDGKDYVYDPKKGEARAPTIWWKK
jgi:tetratricopeptide (TPR) repeat protein